MKVLTAEILDKLLKNYARRDVKFISLDEALKDKAYDINPNVVRDSASTFLNQIRLPKKLENPEIVKKLYNSLPENELDKLCQ